MLSGARADHMDLVLSKLADGGAEVLATDGGVAISMSSRARCVDLVTLPYPGFPTDLQPQMMALLASAEGTSIVTENVFEGRFMFVDELNRMGADIRTEGHHAVIRGVERLVRARAALDIRAGAAMVIAALMADGVTEIEDMYHVDRGYQDLETKLTALGAVVRRSANARPPSSDPRAFGALAVAIASLLPVGLLASTGWIVGTARRRGSQGPPWRTRRKRARGVVRGAHVDP